MKESKRWFAAVLLLGAAYTSFGQGQSKSDPTKQHQQKVKDMVAFLEYVLNTLGSGSTPAGDKDILITQSYSKIFRDGKVQIEDDLAEKRNVITNKDVQAYLKDVDFFFQNVKFEFTIKDIQGKTTANNNLFYKVSLLRNMKGTTADGKAINNTVPRYIEINYDAKDQDLKIVSIYTREFNQKKALAQWWDQLSYEWQSIFERKLNITDSIDLEDIQNITSIDALDLSANKYIQDIEPLGQLTNLRVLNLSNTSITDLSPVRNLTELEELDISGTRITDIAPLRYSEKLIRFNLNNTAVNDISVMEKMLKLQHLGMYKTRVTDLTVLGNLTELRYLNVSRTGITTLAPLSTLTMVEELNASGTRIADLTALAAFKNLTTLYIDSTGVADLSPLAGTAKLQALYANYTLITNLNALQDLNALERVYCDHTQIDRSLADAFMAANPGVLVIFDTDDLKTWWDTLPDKWRKVFSAAIKTGMNPSKEELARVMNLDSVNLSGNNQIRDLEPLRKLRKIQVIIASKTSVKDLSAIGAHKNIRLLDISDTPVEDLSVLDPFQKLTVLRADNSKIQSITPLVDNASLKALYVDHTAINNNHVQDFLSKNPRCLVVYKTDSLVRWWTNLPEEWKGIFKTQVAISANAKREDLHRLVELEVLHFSDAQVNDLTVLREFVRLRDLHFAATGIHDLAPLVTLKTLKSLHVVNSPVRKLEPLAQLTNLEDLDISSTPVEELDVLENLPSIRKLNCAGTQIDGLSALEKLTALEYLDCSNTRVKKISALENLPLKTFKCYNTGISSKTIASFKKKKPECNVVFY